jgi:hypothetical protein
MGAGYAGKNLSSDKAMHAHEVLTAFNDYKLTLPERERDIIDTTLFEFKRKVKAAASMSMRQGKDISKNLAKLNDADLEAMRQYVNKLITEGNVTEGLSESINVLDVVSNANNTASNTASNRAANATVTTNANVDADPLLNVVDDDGDGDASILSFDVDDDDDDDDDDVLEEAMEAMDTFDELDVSTTSANVNVNAHGTNANNSSHVMKVVDLEGSNTNMNISTNMNMHMQSLGVDIDREEKVSSPAPNRGVNTGTGSKQTSPAVSVSSVDTEGSPTAGSQASVQHQQQHHQQQQQQFGQNVTPLSNKSTPQSSGGADNNGVGSGNGYSHLADLTTSPASPLKPFSSSSGSGSKRLQSVAIERPEAKPSPKEKSINNNSRNSLEQRLAGWRENREPLPKVRDNGNDISAKFSANIIDTLSNSFTYDNDSDTMPADLVIEKKNVLGHSHRQEGYMDPGEVIDAKNETLMGLQRQKVWSYAKNAQLQHEVDVLQQQLQQIEAFELELGSTSTSNLNSNHNEKLAPITGQLAPLGSHSHSQHSTPGSNQKKKNGDLDRGSNRDVNVNSNSNANANKNKNSSQAQRGWVDNNDSGYEGQSPSELGSMSMRTSGPGKRGGPPRQYPRDGNGHSLVPIGGGIVSANLGSNLSSASGNSNSNSNYTISNMNSSGNSFDGNERDVDYSGRGGRGRGRGNRQRVPRRRPVPAPSDDASSLDSQDSQQHPQRPRPPADSNSQSRGQGPRGDAWQQREEKEASGNGNESDDSRSQPRRRVPRIRPRQDDVGSGVPVSASQAQYQANMEAQSKQNSEKQNHYSSPSQPSRGPRQDREESDGGSGAKPTRVPRAGRRMTHDTPTSNGKSPISTNVVGSGNRDSGNGSGHPHGRSPTTTLPALRKTNGNSNDSFNTSDNINNFNSAGTAGGGGNASSDNDDNSVSSQQSLRRKRGQNILKNANRRRRHTMEDKLESNGNSNQSSISGLGTLVEGPGSPGRVNSIDNNSNIDIKLNVNVNSPEQAGVPYGTGPRGPVAPVRRRIRQPTEPKVHSNINDDDSVNSANTATEKYQTQSQHPEAKYTHDQQPQQTKATNPQTRKVRPNGGRRATAESAAQLKEQKLKAEKAEKASDKAAQREERRLKAKEQQAKLEEEQEALFSGKAWSRKLNNGWNETELLLQKPIDNIEDLQYTVAAAEAGIMFTDQLNSAAKSLGVLRGTLSRWLLPYDNNTRLDEQSSTAHGVIEAMPEEFRGKLTERQVHYLVAGANSVRKLVRIKIADDNDLEQARQALKTAIAFFKTLQETSAQHNMTPFELLEQRIR